MELLPGVTKEDCNDYVLYYIDNLSLELQNEIRNRLVAVCHGVDQAKSASKIYSYKQTVKDFIKRWIKSRKNADCSTLQRPGQKIVYTFFTINGRPSSFADEILPPPNPPEQLPPVKPRYSIDQFRIEQVTREHAQAENRRSNTGIMQRRFDSRQRAHEEWRKAAEETQRHREELQRISEEGRKSAELARLCEQAAHVEHGFEEVKNRSFHTEDLVEDSFGNRWLECKYCHAIKRGEEFSSLGEYRKPSIGICSDCARKLK